MKRHLPFSLFSLLLPAILSACSNGMVNETNKPSVAFTGLPATITQPAQVISATASDDTGIKNVTFFVDGVQMGDPDTTMPYSVPYTWTAARNGAHTIRAIATDTYGNTAEISQQVTVTLETVPPVVSLSGVPGNVTAPTSITPVVSTSDNVGVVSVHIKLVRMDAAGHSLGTLIDSDFAAGTALPAINLNDSSMNDSYVLTVTARDAAGNVSTPVTQTVNVNIPATATRPGTADTTPPTLSLNVPALVTVAGKVPVTITVADNVGVVSVTGTLTTPFGIQFPLTLGTGGGTEYIDAAQYPNGKYLLTVKACDAAGNCATQQTTTTLAVP